MYKVIGYNSGKVYLTARYKSECFRKLNKIYPNYRSSKSRINKGELNTRLYPEPLTIIKKGVDK